MNFLVPIKKCKVGSLIIENFDHILMIVVLLALAFVLLVVLVVALASMKRCQCKCTCEKKLDEIVSRQNVLSTSLSTRRVMDARNIANERVSQNARMMRAIDAITTRLEGERKE